TMNKKYPDIKILDYIEMGDFFVESKEYKSIADRLGITEWNSVVWIGRLFCMDNDYGEHWFDNWEERELKREVANKLGYDYEEILVISPRRFKDGKDGPCNTDSFRKRFWTDVLKNLKINLSIIIAKALEKNEKWKEIEFKEYDTDLGSKIKIILNDYGIEEPTTEIEREEEEKSLFTKDQIKEIAEQLGVGMKCYINQETDEIKIMVDFDDPYVNMEFWEEDKEELESNWGSYYEVDKMPSRNSFMIMEEFIELVNDRRLKERLIWALNQRKPFRNFKYEVEGSTYREKWFKFKDEANYKWVERQIKGYEMWKKMKEE
ncbi:MAG: UPF0158 family protein, partial [Bacteroidota bacterium]